MYLLPKKGYIWIGPIPAQAQLRQDVTLCLAKRVEASAGDKETANDLVELVAAETQILLPEVFVPLGWCWLLVIGVKFRGSLVTPGNWVSLLSNCSQWNRLTGPNTCSWGHRPMVVNNMYSGMSCYSMLFSLRRVGWNSPIFGICLI